MSFYTKPVTQLPGGIPFTDPRVGNKRFPGMEVSSEEEQITRIIDWRKKNPNVYPPSESEWLDFEKVRLELRKYQKNRLGDNRAYFTDGTNNNVPMIVKAVAPSKACPECGSMEASPRYCKTCSSSKLKGYTCLKCGKERGM